MSEEIDNLEPQEELDESITTEQTSSLLDEHEFSIKTGTLFAIIAFVIVFIVGLIGGVTFLTILWRLFLVSLLFFVIGFGLGFLLKTFVPEVTDLEKASHSEGLGDNIDLSTDDDDEKELVDSSFYQQENDFETVTGKSKDKTDGFVIPDDPKILAKAIQTKLSEDS